MLAIIQKLPAWIHALTLLLASLYGLLTLLAHLPLPPKLKTFAMRFGAWAGDLLTEFKKIDAKIESAKEETKKEAEATAETPRNGSEVIAEPSAEAKDANKP